MDTASHSTHMIPRTKYYFAQQCDGRTLSVSLSVRQQPGDKPLSVSHSKGSLCVYVSLLSWCGLQTRHCQSVCQSESNLCVHVSVLSWCSLETSHCQSVRQTAACVYMSLCCHSAVWKQATVSPSQSSLCAYVSLLSWFSLETSQCQSVR